MACDSYRLVWEPEAMAAYFDSTLISESQLDRAQVFLRDHAMKTPTQPIPGRLKKLKGTWARYWQYDIAHTVQWLYRVDQQNCTVLIDHVWHHADWTKRRTLG